MSADAQAFVKAMHNISSRCGSDFMLENTPTTPAIATIENSDNFDVVTFKTHINILEALLDTNMSIARKRA